jgi:hypothetical protein
MPSTIPAIDAAQSTAFSYYSSPDFIRPYGRAYADKLAAAAGLLPDAQKSLLEAGDYLDKGLEALDAGDVPAFLHNLRLLNSISGVISARYEATR